MEGTRRRGPARRHGRAGVLLVTGAALLASTVVSTPPSWAAGSNGEAAKSAAAILADARHATEKARTAEVVGAIQHYGMKLSLDVTLGHGQGGGTVGEGGVSFDIVLHQPKVYLKAPAATWTKLANSAIASMLANRWLQTTAANKDFVDIANVVDLVKLTNAVTTPSGKLVKKGVTTFRGQPAIALTDSGPNGGTLYVADRGTPYVLGAVGGKKAPGHLNFTEYNSARIPSAPKGALNLNALEAAGGGGSSSSTSISPSASTPPATSPPATSPPATSSSSGAAF
jgi:hypothetical protein